MKYFFNILIISLLSSSIHGQILRPASWHLPVNYDQQHIESAIYLHFPPGQDPEYGLALSDFHQTPAGQYWTFQQTFRHKSVYGASITAKVNPDGRIPFFMQNMLKNKLLPDPQKDRFVLTEMGVRVLLLKRMAAFSHEPEAVWLPDGTQLRAAWLVHSHAQQGTESYELLLDAATGEELRRTDIRAYYAHQMMADTTGQGRVFRPNPCTAAGLPYGVLFSNNDDMHLPIFETYMDTIELKDLKYQNGQFLLEGPYVKLMEFSIPNVPPVSSGDGNFFFRRDQTGFEDVMAYYHIDSYQRYVQSLGYTDLYSTTAIQVDAHGAAGNDQSSFSTNGRIQYGTNYGASIEHVDDAEDADVIIHEYGHALSYAAAPNTRGGNQRIGLEEGYCDYFAAAYSYDIRPDYGWAQVFNWDGHNEFWAGRSADSNRKFASTGLGKYDYAEVWSSAMMRLRQDIGGSMCDRLHLEILYGSAQNMTFFDAYQLLLYADSSLFGGVHSPQITLRFCEIEVVTGGACMVPLEPGVMQARWGTEYVPGEGILIKWQGRAAFPSENFSFHLSNILGQHLAEKGLKEGNMICFPGLPEGIYIISLYENENLLESRKVVVW